MKKINENTKVTLTLGQLKKLVKETTESNDDWDEDQYLKNIDGFEVDTQMGVVFSYSGKKTSVTTPPGMEVLDGTFEGNKRIRSVTVSDGVRDILGDSFNGCSNLESVTLPDSVDCLDGGVFAGCPKLVNVKMSRTLFDKLKKWTDPFEPFKGSPWYEKALKDSGVSAQRSLFKELFKKGAKEAFDYIAEHIDDFKEYDWGMNRVRVHLVFKEFTRRLVAEPYGFSFMNLKHAHGIGNNNEWDVIKSGKKIGTFYCTDDMFGGVRTGVTIDGRVVDKREF